MGFVIGFCALLFGLAVVSLALGGLNELFGLGIWDDDYPVIDFGGGEGGGSATVPGTYGEMAKQFGLTAAGSGILGSILYYYFGE